MTFDHLSKFSIYILLSLIGCFTFISLVVFHQRPVYIVLLACLFILSGIKAAISTSIENQKHILSRRLAGKIIKPNASNESSSNDRRHRNCFERGHEPKVDLYTPANSAPETLTVEQYLAQHNFMLSDEIMKTIEWKRFEFLCHEIFKATGYNSRLTGNGADQGVDIRIFSEDNSELLYLVQCKKFRKGNNVDRAKIQQLRGQMAAENVAKGGYCITSNFTKPAVDFASANNIELFDQPKITNSFNQLGLPSRAKILKQLLEGDYWTPSCASCGQKLQPRRRKDGKMVWACTGGIKQHGWSSINYYRAAPIQNVR